MRKIVFFGDSNTYGYDPRDFSGGRYPEEKIWTFILSSELKGRFEIINEGMNGRRIPAAGMYGYADSLIDVLECTDIFAIMLGTNDMLMTLEPDAEKAALRMDRFLAHVTDLPDHPIIFLIAPVPAGSAECADIIYRNYFRECMKMNAAFGKLAVKYELPFADTSEWGIDLAYDMSHFSQKGHETFAAHIKKIIESRDL